MQKHKTDTKKKSVLMTLIVYYCLSEILKAFKHGIINVCDNGRDGSALRNKLVRFLFAFVKIDKSKIKIRLKFV